MSRRKRKQKKGMNPALAVCILLGSGAFVANSLGLFGDDSAKELASLIGYDEGDDLELEDESQNEEIRWTDLLAVHGSHDGDGDVRTVFAALPDAGLVAAAPAGEMAPTRDRWVGADPPELRLGVVMVSARSRRAVLGGEVVGVGESIGGGRVLSIEPGVVRLSWQSRVLTYDLDGPVPREFRAEKVLRGAEAERDADQADGEGSGTRDELGSEEIK